MNSTIPTRSRAEKSAKPKMVDGVLVTDTAIFSAQKDGTVLICDASLPMCKLCDTDRALFVNRHGKTRCIDCDGAYVTSRAKSEETTK